MESSTTALWIPAQMGSQGKHTDTWQEFAWFSSFCQFLFLFTNPHAHVRCRVDKETQHALGWQMQICNGKMRTHVPAGSCERSARADFASTPSTHGLLHSGQNKPMKNAQNSYTMCLPEHGGSEREPHRQDVEITYTGNGEIRLPPEKNS